MAPQQQWRVLIVVNHPAFRETVRHVLSAAPQFVILAETGTAEGAIEIVQQLELDLILLDLHLPGQNGLAAATAIKAAQPKVTILMLSGDWSPAYERRANAVGVQARLAKQNFSLSEIYEVLDLVGPNV